MTSHHDEQAPPRETFEADGRGGHGEPAAIAGADLREAVAGLDERDVAAMAALFDASDVAAIDEVAVARLERFARTSAVAQRPRPMTAQQPGPARSRWRGWAAVAGFALAAAIGALVLRPTAPTPETSAVALAEAPAAAAGSWSADDPLDFFGTSATYAQADLLPDELDEAWADDGL